MMLYLLYVLIAAVLILLELIYFRIADRFNIIDRPNKRSSHTFITLRGGGVVFPLAMCCYIICFGMIYPLFFLGLLLAGVVSFIDDVHPLPNWIRVVAQFAAMILLMLECGDMLIWHNWYIVALGLITCVGIVNAYNFMDGINGITGGYSFAVLASLWVMNSKVPFIDPLFLAVASISVLVFCWFNYRTRPKCFAGDVGAVSIAFIVLFALTRLILKTGDWTYLFFLAVYGADSIMTIVHRIYLRENIFLPHRKHLYQLMANELHIPHTVVSSIYIALQGLISAGLIWLPMNNVLYCAILFVLLIVVYVAFIKRYYYLHEQATKKITKE